VSARDTIAASLRLAAGTGESCEMKARWVSEALTTAGYTIIRDDENHKATVERCIAVAEAERKKHDTGSGFDSQPAYAAAFAIRSRLRSLIKEDGDAK